MKTLLLTIAAFILPAMFCPAATPAAPSINEISASAGTGGVATIIGKVSSNGKETAVSAVYGETTDYGKKTETSVFSPDSSGAAFSLRITGLKYATTYHYKVLAKNGIAPNAESADGQIVIPAEKPGVSAPSVNVLSATSAEISADVIAKGAETTVLVNYGTTNALGSTQSATAVVAADKTGNAKIILTGLTKATYFYEVVATNSVGETKSTIAQFTVPQAPEVTAAATADVTTARVTARVTSHGDQVSVKLEYGETDDYGRTKTLNGVSDSAIRLAQIFDLTGLKPGTTYHYQVTVTNTGTGSDSTGDLTFTTLPVTKPVVSAIAGNNSATILDKDGNAAGAYKIFGTESGKFTARISIGGNDSIVTGQLDSEGKFYSILPDGTGVRFGIEEENGKPVIAAEFQRGDSVFTADTSVSEVTSARKKALAGLYTLAIPAPATSATPGQTANGLPEGAGYMRLTVKDWGGVRVQGVLGDGSKFSYSSNLAGTDAAAGVPMWLSPKDARVSGTVTLVGTEDVTATGSLNWYRPSDKGADRFEDGFYTSVNAVGGLYTPPTKNQRLLNAESSDVTITFKGGNLASNIVVNGTIDSRNRITFGKGPLKQMSIDIQDALVTGRFEPTTTGKDVKFVAALVPQQNKATGSFAGLTTTGSIEITPGRTAQPAPTPQPQPDPDNSGNPGIDFGN
jgi:hypothetical protein